MERRLTRDFDNRIIAGVCSGLAKYLKTDPNLVRLVTVLLFFITGGGILIAYLVLAVVIPTEQNWQGKTSGKTSGSMKDFNTKVKKKPVGEFTLNPDDYIIDEADYKMEDKS